MASHQARSSPSSGHATQQPQQQLRLGADGSLEHSQPNTDFNADATSVGLDFPVDQQQQKLAPSPDTNFNPLATSAEFLNPQQHLQQAYNQANGSAPTFLDPSTAASAAGMAFNMQSHGQQSYLPPHGADGDFSSFPAANLPANRYNAALFEQPGLSLADLNQMASAQPHHSPTPPNLIPAQVHSPGLSPGSPSYSQQHYPSAPTAHSTSASLDPQAAFLSNQTRDWAQPQFCGHRRTPSDFSDVSSVSPSPNLANCDTFDDIGGLSPLQQPADAGLYQEVLNMGSFSIADANQSYPARSPSLSPAISPRINAKHMSELVQPGVSLNASDSALRTNSNFDSSGDLLPSMESSTNELAQMAPPAINIDFAPNNGKASSAENLQSPMDQDSLTPPDRGRLKSRPRSVTDPYRSGGASLGRTNKADSLSPTSGSGFSSRSGSARSLSPFDRQAPSTSRARRQSTPAAPNNLIALRLVDSKYQGSQESGVTKRVQKHPATFQCPLCTKRFTRAYNLRSHHRTHTDERPFVCTVCGKAFARQHDRKRHEGLHSGEKKFVCKGDLKEGGQWGCGRRFARADALGRHFRSEAGRICIKPLLDEEITDRQGLSAEQAAAQDMNPDLTASSAMAVDTTTSAYSLGTGSNYVLPAVLLAQYPALAQLNWSQMDSGGGGGLDEELSGRSSFDASDYEEIDDGDHSGDQLQGFTENEPGTNFGDGGYVSDLGIQ